MTATYEVNLLSIELIDVKMSSELDSEMTYQSIVHTRFLTLLKDHFNYLFMLLIVFKDF